MLHIIPRTIKHIKQDSNMLLCKFIQHIFKLFMHEHGTRRLKQTTTNSAVQIAEMQQACLTLYPGLTLYIIPYVTSML